MAIIKTSTYPNGPAKHLDLNDVVQLLLSNGRFKDSYVGELTEGDEYYAPSPREKPRTDADRWAYMVEHKLEFIHQHDLDGKIDFIDVDSGVLGRGVLVQGMTSLKTVEEAIDYLMDMDTLGPA